jgi:cation diffusion facilitator CzcD-associated flavoprotein CzcO
MLYSDEKLFTVTTSKGIRYARTVVLAVGPGNQPKVPGFLLTACGAGNELPQACHSMQIKCFPDYTVQKKIKEGRETNILVVGGGLTSAQLSDLAVRKGVTRVWHVMRGSCRVKPFDLDLDWMSKYRNFQQACFWSADSDEERLQMIQRARNGGSITSFFDKKLKEHCASGRLKLMTNTLVVNAVFGPALEQAGPGGLWTVKTDPQVSDLPPMDYIYFATGIQTDFTQLNYLQTMQKTYPITEVGGFPCLDDRLRWRNDVPLFVTGKMAALKLGPGAGNLGGAKFGAERISLALADLLLRNRSEGRDTRSNEEKAKHKDGSVSYCTGLGSKYTCLNASLPV